MKIIWKQRYQIIEKIGHGSTGSVYKVRDIHLEKEWALKFLEKRGIVRTTGKSDNEYHKS